MYVFSSFSLCVFISSIRSEQNTEFENAALNHFFLLVKKKSTLKVPNIYFDNNSIKESLLTY